MYTAPSRTEAITMPTGRSSSRQPTQTCPLPTTRASSSRGERHVERLVDEPKAREAHARLVLDRSQARNLVRAGEANLVGTGRLVHGVMLVRRLHRGTAALTLGDGVLASGR